MIGSSLGPYKIVHELGAGGMGEVYLAEDTRLGRRVAVKVLPAQFSADPERLARFEQEARAAAALNHPHIAAVFDVGRETSASGDTVHFMVQEYLEGDPLRVPLDHGAMPLKKTLTLGAEIGAALAAAHAAGIVHRDLKPENIFITRDGHAKVLDFGLAKLTEAAPAQGAAASMSPTVLGTVAGQIMGTAGYMAPEQVGGGEVDARADLFAFGCVLYEMVTGRRAFSGKNLPETLHRLANTDPAPITEAVPTLPLKLCWIIDKALAKDPDERYQSAADMVVDLKRMAIDPDTNRPADAADLPPGRASGVGSALRAIPWVIAALALIVAGWSSFGTTGATDAGRPLFVDLSPLPLSMANGAYHVSLSPDGRRLAFVQDDALHLLDLGAESPPELIPGTTGAELVSFSPDGTAIAFAAEGELRIVRPGGGLPRTVATGLSPDVYGIAWTPDGRLLYVPIWAADIHAVSTEGGAPRVVASPDPARNEQGFSFPSMLPDGEHVLYGMWDERWNVAVRSLITNESRILARDGHAPRYLPSGHLVYAQDQQLLAAPFDIDTFEVGEPIVVVENLYANFSSGFGGFDVSDNGTLVYLRASGSYAGVGIWRVAADGTRSLFTDQRQRYDEIALSADGTRAVVAIIDAQRAAKNLWLLDTRDATLAPLTTGGANWMTRPVLLPDGEHVAYVSETTGEWAFRTHALDGSDRDESRYSLETAAGLAIDHGWTPDGTVAFAAIPKGMSDYDVWTWPSGADEPQVLLTGPEDQLEPSFRPDGGALAFSSDRTGRQEIYLTPFPVPDQAVPRQVSSAGGIESFWSRDGDKLWFRNGEGQVFEVEVDDELQTSEPVPRFQEISSDWAIVGDGSFVVTLEEPPPPRLRMVLNWFDVVRGKLEGAR